MRPRAVALAACAWCSALRGRVKVEGRRFTIPAASEARPPLTLAARIQRRDGFACAYCGARGVPLEVDHVRARAHFAATASGAKVNSPQNLVTACEDCNGAKGPQNLDGFAAMLRGRGLAPRAVASMRRRVRAASRRRLPFAVVP